MKPISFTKSDAKKEILTGLFFLPLYEPCTSYRNEKNPAYAGFPLYPRKSPYHFFLLFSMINRTMPAINAAEPVMIARSAIGDLSPVFTL